VIPSPDPSGATRLSRRGFLTGAGLLAAAGGAGALGVDEGVLPGRSWLYRHLGPDGVDGVVPRVPPGRTVSGSFVSDARLGQRCGWTIAFPPGEVRENLPVAVVLHGRGNDHASAFSRGYLGLDRFLAASVRAGGAPVALASVDGGDTYWHARDNGEDAGAMVLDEFLPLLADRGLDTGRVGFLGWSMGGYGALVLAARLGRNRTAAVAAESPALWHEFEDSTRGAFDDAADFADATAFGRQHALDGIPVRVDCGEGDPFYAAVRDYVHGFKVPPAGGFQPGGHQLGYWRRMAPHQLHFLARALSPTTG
jgi:dienelactone hydrolase